MSDKGVAVLLISWEVRPKWMNSFREDRSRIVEFFFQEVFDRFHIVVGDLFDFLDAAGISDAEVEVDVPETSGI